MFRLNTLLLRSSLLALASLGLALQAHAVSITVGFDGNPGSFATLTDQDATLGCESAGSLGQLSCVGSGLDNGGWTLDNWDLDTDPDPTITNVFSVTNNTPGTQSFVVAVALPTSISFGPPSLIRGSIQGGATDNNFDGVTLSNSGTSSIYDGLIDGATVRTLFDDPTTASGFGSVSLGTASFGIPVQESVAVATLTSIGLTLRFDLTAGDSASFTANFDVQPVPEPGTALLLGLGLAGLAVRRERA
ncbi:MAG: PEP-CTERM sorting domain-containing protein [Myxococcota bacterium]